LVVVLAASILAAASCGGGGGEGSVPRTDAGTEEPATTGETATEPTPLELEGGKALAIGSEGESVRQLQEALLVLGHDPGGVDGAFGPATRRAVIAFQRDQELDADGIVGQATVAAINKELAAFTEDSDR
jgi:peptidoglycan hydrolase-like protein with peptidoglycan-binding domain